MPTKGRSKGTPANRATFFCVLSRLAVAAFESWLHAQGDRQETTAVANQRTSDPPRDYNNQVYVDRVLVGFGQDATSALQKNIDELHQLVATARSQDTQALLFKLPYADQLERTPLVRGTRRFMLSRFSSPDDWLSLTIQDRPAVARWNAYGRAIRMVAARAIEQAINERSKAPR
ncbi:hypothetical protein ACVWYH_007203 [Bradyrhizobium sp. GM24.11]